MNFKANGRIWIDLENKAYLGYGRIELLEKTRDLGSIRQAAIEMKISIGKPGIHSANESD